ncbi:MAG: RDD family protein [Treponema sp.]|jgi:uncharacterized RDD family membrane protein YckC|nr:RDD family protein [Treponema sp.]
MNTKRIIAGFIDYLIACLIQMVLMALFFLKPLMGLESDEITFNVLVRGLVISYCSISFLIIRDIIGKRSIGKRFMKLKIVNKNDGNESNFLKRFVRNITWLLGPFEIIVFLITKERMGDKIAGTDIKTI